MHHWRLFLIFLGLAIFWVQDLSAQIPERRSNGASKELGWFIAPTPFSVKGIGQAVPVFGILTNFYETTDVIGVKTLPGDTLEISAVFVDEFPVFTDHFQLTAAQFRFKNSFLLYDRGIDSDPDNYIQPLAESNGNFYEATLLFFEERLELFYQQSDFETTTLKIFDPDGELLSDEKTHSSFTGSAYGYILDITDDKIDPRIGVRWGQKLRPVLSDHSSQSDIEVTDSDLTGYISFFGRDTLVLNAFTSTSKITRKGITDETQARALLSQGCSPDYAGFEACTAAEDKLVADFLAYNRYGLASKLGGDNRLRAYALGRFSAGNAAYQGIEYRWNLSDKEKKVNWFVLGGIETLVQAAFFYEQGTVAEHSSDLTSNNIKSSYGAGLRALISGFVYRLDLALGDEGPGVVLFIGYPMNLKPNSE